MVFYLIFSSHLYRTFYRRQAHSIKKRQDYFCIKIWINILFCGCWIFNVTNMATEAQTVVLYCEKHPTEENDMYCRRCKITTCTTCLRTIHNDHEFDTIAKYSKRLANDRAGFLKALVSKYERKTKPKRRKFCEVRCHNDHVLSYNVTSLEERRAKLHCIIDELVDKDMKTCRTQNAKLMENLNRVQQKETENDDKIKEMLSTFEKTTMTGLDIIEYYDKLSSLVERMKSDLDIAKYRDMFLYREGEVDKCQLQRMVGDVKEAEWPSVPPEIVMLSGTTKTESTKHAIKQPATAKFFSMFRSKNAHEEKNISKSDEANQISAPGVHSICLVSHDEAWVNCKGESALKLLNKSGQVQDTVPHQTDSNSFFVMNDQGFISADEQAVVRIEHSGKTTNVKNTSPYYPVHVGLALSGNILVTLVDEIEFTRTAASQRKVQMISQGGELLHTYEFGEDGSSPALTMPCRPIQNFNSNVCVINVYDTETGGRKGSVCGFFEDERLKFVYRGHGKVLWPMGMCCDSQCNILCTNYVDASIHIDP